MTGRILRLDTSTHQAVQELLPWFVTNMLDADEAAFVQEHLRTCSQCQSDAECQRRLRAALAQVAPVSGTDAERAFTLLSARLEAPRRKSFFAWLMALRELLRKEPPWVRWVMAIEAAMIASLALLLAPQDRTLVASYRGLGTPGSHAGGNIIVTFRPGTTEQQLRHILQKSGARIVDGPTVTDAYVLSVPDMKQAEVVEALRSAPTVAQAHLLNGGSGR